MTNQPSDGYGDLATVARWTVTCAADRCSEWLTVDGDDLRPLLAAGPYRCPDHVDVEEVPC